MKVERQSERMFVQRGLFDEPVALRTPIQSPKTILPQADVSTTTKIKARIKKLIAENSSRKTSMGRFDIERSVVDLYKSLSEAYEKLGDKQHQLYYEKIHTILKWILFKGTNKKPIPYTARKIRENIIKVTKGFDNDKVVTAKNMAMPWRNLLKASILAAEGLAQSNKEFPIPKG